MIASWGLLAFLKAADTRQNASFAIRLDRKSEFKDHLADGDFQNPEDIFSAVDGWEGQSAQSISEQMDQDPEFQKFWEEKQRQAERELKAAQKVQPAQQAPRPKKKRQAQQARPQTQVQQQPVQQQPAQQPAPQARPQAQAGQQQARPQAQSGQAQPSRRDRPEPAPQPRTPSKPRPRPVSYENVDDDAFFRSLDEKSGRPEGRPTIQTYDSGEEDQPVTLEDLFGGDNK